MPTAVFYTTQGCPHCAKARAFLRKNETQFTEYDVNKDEIRWREAMALAGDRDIVPAIDIDGKIFFGAYTAKMEHELKKALVITR